MIASSVSPANGSADAYTDLSSLNAIRDLGREDKNQALEKIATQFESMMVRMMMKSMRAANEVFEEGSYFSSHAGDMYQEMYDDQLALSLSQGDGSEGKGFGIAEVMIRQLQARFGSEKAPSAETSFDGYKDRRVAVNADISGLALGAREERVSNDVSTSLGDNPKNSESALSPSAEKQSFDGTPKAFIDQLYSLAKASAEKLGTSPGVLIAQAALETGWGNKMTQRGNHQSLNLFNIKADSRWQGSSVSVPTIEVRNGTAVKEVASFRAYQSLQHSFEDYADFISNSPRYAKAIQATTSEGYIRSIDEAGYATDPNYSDKVLRILNSDSFQEALSQQTRAAL